MPEKIGRIWIRVKKRWGVNRAALSLSFDSRDNLSRFLAALAYQEQPIDVTIGKR